MDTKKILKRILGGVLALLAVSYVIFHFVKASYTPVTTEKAYTYTAYDMVETKAFAVRDESIIYSNQSGVSVNAVEDGTKVAATTVVKRVFSSVDAAQAYQQLRSVNEDIDYYETIHLHQQTHNIDKTTNDNNLKSTYYDILDAIDSNNLSQAFSNVRNMELYITRRQLLVGEKFELAQTISELKSQREALTVRAQYSNVMAGKVGYYSGTVDGYEGLISYDNIDNITMAQINSAVSSAPSVVDSAAVGKINESFTWYFLCVVDTAAISGVSSGDMVEVNLPFQNIDAFEMKVRSITNADAEHCVLVLESTLMDSKLANLRVETVQLRLAKYSGVRIRSQALRVDKDGNTGVYVLLGNLVTFRKTECLYTTGDYMVVSYSGSDKNSTLEIYDSVIYEGKNLYDGRVL
ncbi:MAG: hypothetical protein IKY44_05825 [Clostridia bacterium]|nr:hypothetical protein [Clostridia bacterium]